MKEEMEGEFKIQAILNGKLSNLKLGNKDSVHKMVFLVTVGLWDKEIYHMNSQSSRKKGRKILDHRNDKTPYKPSERHIFAHLKAWGP